MIILISNINIMDNSILLIEKKAYVVMLTYVCILVAQMYIIKHYIFNWQSLIKGANADELKFNVEHKKELNVAFGKEITTRLTMLKEMSYADWLSYNNRNPTFKFEGNTYDIAVWERAQNDVGNYQSNSRFILRANRITENVGLTWIDILRQMNYTFVFSVFKPNPDFLQTIFEGSHYSGDLNLYSYFTVDAQTNRAVKTNAISGVWKKTEDKDHSFEGLILLGYPLLDVEQQYANKYYDFVDNFFVLMISLGTIVVSLLLYYSSQDRNVWSALLFLFITNGYLTHFLNTTEGITDLKAEQDKVKDINDGIMSVSFLAAVNIYILQSLKKNSGSNSLHNETAFLFTIGLVLLLLSLYKQTNYNTIDEIRGHRIQKQIMFNLSILVNAFILINFGLHTTYDSKIFESMKKVFIV